MAWCWNWARMKIEYTLRTSQRAVKATAIPPDSRPTPRPPRITCLLALAHRLEELVQSGQVNDYAELARVGHVSRARVTQILRLLTLAPSIQEQILSWPTGSNSLTERHMRKIVNQLLWTDQRKAFDRLQISRPRNTLNEPVSGRRVI